MESHGPGSSLIGHLREVSSVAETLEERIICACHDIGKSTPQWQAYSSGGFRGRSPHRHAASGAALAATVIQLIGRENALLWATTALHTGAAHHSHLGTVTKADLSSEVETELSSPQCRAFFVDSSSGIASLLPEIPAEVMDRAWERFGELSSLRPSPFWNEFLSGINQLSVSERLSCFSAARDLLGRLSFVDNESARKQQGTANTFVGPHEVFSSSRAFHARKAREYGSPEKSIDHLRARISRAFRAAVESTEDEVFAFIDAPTGLGKTEAMLGAAESLIRADSGLDRIVFAVPQVSIADQVAEEYLHDADAQIWNYLRKAYLGDSNATEASEEHPNSALTETIEYFHQPFNCSYNVTTFNQVLLAMAHPERRWCVRSLGLKNAVVILDEFHKLPLTVLPLFFRIAEHYAHTHDCRFILGSATPLADLAGLRPEGLRELPPGLREEVYQAPELNDRRRYHNIGDRSVGEIVERIESHRSSENHSLLVVMNLVGSGTKHVREAFQAKYDPWAELDAIEDEDFPVVFLDGLTPPLLRRELVQRCRRIIAERPLVLVTTQMVEVGVDLDFDQGLIDFQGWASTIQRGGRIGREGRDSPAHIDVYRLIRDDGTNSFDRLLDVQQKHDIRFKLTAFSQLASMEKRFHRREQRGFTKWAPEEVHTDESLKAQLLRDQEKAYRELDASEAVNALFQDFAGMTNDWGLTLQNSQFVAELYSDTGGEEVLLVEDMEVWNTIQAHLEAIDAGEYRRSDELKRLVTDRTVRVFDTSFLDNSAFSFLAQVEALGWQSVYLRSSETIL
jgi:superfamily II DNA or RNA helicase